VSDNLKSWDLKLCQAEFSPNHVVNHSIGFSPFQVVYSNLPKGPLDLTVVPQPKGVIKRASDFVGELAECHRILQERLVKTNEKYKQFADKKHKSVDYKEGDLVYAVLTKDRFPIGAYNKLKARKIGPVEILKKINDNAYQLKLPDDVYTSYVFNVKHLIPYYEEEQSGEEDQLNSRTNSFQPGEDDIAQQEEDGTHLKPPSPLDRSLTLGRSPSQCFKSFASTSLHSNDLKPETISCQRLTPLTRERLISKPSILKPSTTYPPIPATSLSRSKSNDITPTPLKSLLFYDLSHKVVYPSTT